MPNFFLHIYHEKIKKKKTLEKNNKITNVQLNIYFLKGCCCVLFYFKRTFIYICLFCFEINHFFFINVNEDLKFIGDDTLVVVDGICPNIDRKIEEQFVYFAESGIIFDSLEDVMNRGIIPSILITSLTENQVVDSIVRLNISSSTMTPTVLNNNIEGSEDTAALLNHPTILTYELFTNI